MCEGACRDVTTGASGGQNKRTGGMQEKRGVNSRVGLDTGDFIDRVC